MQKSIRLSDYYYPYDVLISKFLHYFEVDLEEEQTEVVKASHEINNDSLSKMGFTKIGGKWINKDGDQAGSSSGAHAKDSGEEQADIVVAGGDDDARFQVGEDDDGPSAGIMGERITSMSPFDRLMLRRMDKFADEQRNHHEFCVTHQTLHKKVSHLSIESRTPPNLEKASAKEEEVINQNIKSSSFWYFPQDKSYVNKLGSLHGSKIAR